MEELPETMLGWTKSRGEIGGFSLEKHTIPIPKEGEVLVKTHSTSICGTDVHIWKWDEWAKGNIPIGTITGHETCGVIIAMGSNVTTHTIGDRVAIECHLACWNCARCEEGNAHVCENGRIFGVHTNGAFAPYFTIPATNAKKLPKGLTMGNASIQDPLGNAIHTLTGGPVKGSIIAIHGLGPIGLFAVNAAKAMGASKIIAVDWDNEERMKLAKKLGADLVLGKNNNITEEILANTKGRGVDNSCEFSGAPQALSNAIKTTRKGGYVNILSVYGDNIIKIPINEIVFRYLHVKGINGRKMWSTWDIMHQLLEQGKIDVNTLITHRMPIKDFNEAMKLAITGDCGKIVLEF